MKLEVVTPERMLFSIEAGSVTLPTKMGEVGILPGHIQLLTELDTGILTYSEGGIKHKLAVHFGYAEIIHDRISVLAESCNTVDELDPAMVNEEIRELETAMLKPYSLEEAPLREELNLRLRMARTRKSLI